MNRESWKSVTSHKGCEWSTWLHESAHEMWAMLCAIPRFFAKRLPEILRVEFAELNRMAISCCRVGYHLGKFLAAAAAWLAALLLPVIVYPGWITVAWLVLAICGSVWGIRQYAKRR